MFEKIKIKINGFWKWILFSVIGVSIAFAAPLVPVDMTYLVSTGNPMFDTTDGDLELDEYAQSLDMPEKYYVRVNPKETHNIEATTSPNAISGKKKVGIIDEEGLAYGFYMKKNGDNESRDKKPVGFTLKFLYVDDF